MTQPSSSVSPSPTGTAAQNPVTMWVAHCPFRKTGSPVLGNMGASVRRVILFDADEWKKLCEIVPQLQTTQFRVGTFE